MRKQTEHAEAKERDEIRGPEEGVDKSCIHLPLSCGRDPDLVPASAGGWPGPCSRVKIYTFETQSKRSEKNGPVRSLTFLHQHKQTGVVLAFSKCIHIDSRQCCHPEGELCQRLVCLPFPSRRKGIHPKPRGRCPDTREEFMNNNVSLAQATQRACEHSSRRACFPGGYIWPPTRFLA